MCSRRELTRLTRRVIRTGDRYVVPQDVLLAGLLPGGGDAAAKTTAFWVLLVASAYIAAAGVMTDSTAAVIGAMVIAPLGGPIFGLGAALITEERAWPVFRRLLGAVIAVIVIGMLVQSTSIERIDPLENPQILGRSEPSLIDMFVAFATGFVGAMALTRKDIAPALSGVAIAISLVPPLAVVGVSFAGEHYENAAGALLLFLTNMVAIVLAAMLVFGAAGVGARYRSGHAHARRAVWSVAGLIIVVLMLSSAGTGLLAADQRAIADAARDWAGQSKVWRFVSAERAGNRIVVRFVGDAAPPKLSGSYLERSLSKAAITDAAIDVRFEAGGTVRR